MKKISLLRISKLMIRGMLLAFIFVVPNAPAYAQSDVIKVGVYNNPPIAFPDKNGKYTGFCIEVLEYIASKEGWSLQYVPGSFAECRKRLDNGSIDLQVYIAYSIERARLYDFTKVNLISNWGQLLSRPDLPVNSILDLEGKTVAAIKNTIFEKAFKDLMKKFDIKCRFLEVDTPFSLLKAIEEKKADAGVLNRIFCETKAKGYNVLKTPIIFNPVEIRFAMPQGKNQYIGDAIDKHLVELKADKNSPYYISLSKIFGVANVRVIPLWLKLSLVVGLVLFLFGTSLILKYQVRQKTAQLANKNILLEEEINERMRAEAALQQSEEKYRALYDNAPLSYQSLDKNGDFLDVNPFWLRTLGYEREEVVGKHFAEFLHPDWKPQFEKNFPEFKRLGYVHDVQFKIRHKDGHYLDISFEGCIGYRPDGSFHQTYCVFNDITELKLVENKITRFGRIFEDSLNEIFLFDVDTLKFTQVNSAAQHNLGYTMEELLKLTPVDLKPEYTTESFTKLAAPLRKGEKKKIVFETVHKRKDHSLYDVEVHLQLLKYEDKALFSAIILDITERKRAKEDQEKLQEQLLQSQKMEAIGSLAGGIAHEFNNILTTIIGNTQLAIGDIPERNPARECLEEIRSASLRAKDVVRQLLGFARKSVFQLQPVHLSPVIKEAMILIRASTLAAIEIRQNLSCESDTVMADSSQINLALLNLCTNARNAMQEEGGVLEVKLENTTLDDKSAAGYEDLGPGNYAKMTVRDTGHGIDPKIIDRIFEPYFTTGSLAEASGMGLAVVHGIVKRHNGAIIVESEPGKGTVFEVLFPLTEKKK